MDRTDYFNNRAENFAEQAEAFRKHSNKISSLRLIVFFSGAALSYFSFSNISFLTGWLMIFLTISCFIFLIKKHNIINSKLERMKLKSVINREYMERLTSKWIDFKDNGQEYVDPLHEYTLDLDIFGEKSLFQYLNVARTFHGRKSLAFLLSRPETVSEAIKIKQKAVEELAGKIEFCQQLQIEGRLNKKAGNDPGELIADAENETRLLKNKLMENVFYILPALTLLSLVFSSLNVQIPYVLPIILIVIQLIIYAFSYKRISKVFGSVGKFKNDIMVFGKMIHLIENEEFKEELLKNLTQCFKEYSGTTSKKIKKLEGIAEAIDIRFSPLIHFFLNLFLLWDFHCIFALEEWRKQNGRLIRIWIENIGQFEALASLAVIPQLHPAWIFPEATDGKPEFSAQALGHPLISDDKRVCNNVEINNQLCVITGSNMSGKTTLLRTIGISLVLAYAGAPVCAAKMRCPVMDIYTSMRINDDLNSGISTFYAELLRIKLIIDRAKTHKNMIFLIDELFRGTNSKDRIIGAVQVMKALDRDWIIGLLSTHDSELCELEKENRDRIINYHFTEIYKDNKIHFDYKLRKGRSTTSNARYLMRMIGIDIVD